MEINGFGYKKFSLTCQPAQRFKRTKGTRRPPTPVFEPYVEALPLESGYYAFVIDDGGKFRVERGNTRAHASIAGSVYVGAAGFFRITRAGKVGMVHCVSDEYSMYFKGPRDLAVIFVVDAFRRHQAFDLSRHCYFKFVRFKLPAFIVDAEGNLCDDEAARLDRLDAESVGITRAWPFTNADIEAFAHYEPSSPPRLYGMHKDQLERPMEYDEFADFAVGPFQPPYSPSSGRLESGRKAFVVDPHGYLVVGCGHHLLAGGNPVGAAGQLIINEYSEITEVNLNFSGHFRPPLTAEYACYTYRTIKGHPLLRLAEGCRITGRADFNVNSLLKLVSFDEADLLSDVERLEAQLDEGYFLDGADDEDPEDDGLIWR